MNRFQALMAGLSTVVGIGGVAAYNGFFSSPPTIVENVIQPVSKPALVQPLTTTASTPVIDSPSSAELPKSIVSSETPVLTAPTFDVLRVESNGSVLIAGNATKDAQVEVLSGANVLGSTKAGANGDFIIVMEKPLKPGDYQLVLRQTLSDGTAATSVETATVSVPETPNGPVLALVEEPGKPSRIITTPENVAIAVAKTDDKPANTQFTDQSNKAPDPAASVSASVTIEAVETEGRTLFVSGTAKGVATVRVYANDIILGDIKPNSESHFILEVEREVARGDYIIKAEGLSADGVTVMSRSSVPFKSNEEQIVASTSELDSTAVDATGGKQLAVTIKRGDTLWQISRRIYGRGVRYSTIYLANKDAIPNPNKIFPGQVVAIPSTTPEGDAANGLELRQ